MNKLATILSVLVLVLFVAVAPALAQGGGTTSILTGAPIGIGLVVLGAAFGIGKLASSAYESMARQPEVAPAINTAMIIAAALIEGFTLFALVIFFLKAGTLN